MQTKLSIGNSAKAWEQLKRDLPKKVAARCVSFFLEAFRKEGWTDQGFVKWKPRKDKKNKRSLLIGKPKSGQKHLRQAVNSSTKMATWELIKFEVDLPYADIHNRGFNSNENVKSYTRKVKTPVKVTSSRVGLRTTVRATVGETQVKAHVRHMKMPKREYMGNSAALNKIIIAMIKTEIKKSVFK